MVRYAVSGLLAVWAVVVVGDAQAYSPQGHEWPNPDGSPVPFMMDPTGSDDIADDSEFEAIRRAFATWEAVSCSHLSFSEVAWSAPLQVRNDGSNRIMFVEDEMVWPGESGTLALTYTFFNVGDGPITDADMIFNGAHWTWTTVDAEVGQGTPAKVDLQTVAFHEIGHFFGLDHSNDPGAAMYPSNNDPIRREPGQDDILGICALYSNGQPIPGTNNQGGPLGAACVREQDCASGLCLNDQSVGRSYCTKRCTPAQAAACENGLTCEETAEFGALCFVPLPTEELCDQCVNSEQCSSGLCLRSLGVNGDQPFCTRACDPTPGQPAQCPGGFNCQTTQTTTGFVGACVPNSGICDPNGKGGQNEICYANGACKAAHFCLEYTPNSGLDFCYAQCDFGAVGQPCGLERTVCTPLPGDRQLAACITYAGEGEPCVPEVCVPGAFCAWDENVGVDTAICYRTCNGTADCQANHQCTPNPGIPSLCVPNEGFKLDGQGCTANAECNSGLCRIIGNNQLCTQTCSTQDPDACSAGLRCLPEPGSTQGLCWPSQLSDPTAKETPRVGQISQDFCACDSTNSCDSNCDCDPECDGCGCTTTNEGLPLSAMAFLLLWGLRRRRRISA